MDGHASRVLASTLMRARTLLLLAIVAQVVFFVAARRDVPADDALGYAESAHWMTADPSYFAHPNTHPFAMRVGITLPLLALFHTVGISTWTVNLPCLLASIAILMVVYASARSERAKRVGLGLASSSTAFLLYGTELNADWLCGAAVATSMLLLVRDRRAIAVAVWFLAFLIKETAIWFAPVWIYVLVIEVRSVGWRTAVVRFAPALVTGLLLIALYLSVCAWVWGDPLARVTGINALASEHLWTPQDQSTSWWVHRLVWGPPVTFVMALGVPVVLAAVGSRHVARAERVWLVAIASYLFLFWFGSASTSRYVPLPLGQRRMLMEVLPCVLVAATLTSDALRWRRWSIALVIVAAIAPFGWTLARAIRRDRPEAALHERIRDGVRATEAPVVVVCPDFRCLAAVPFAFGYALPTNLRLVSSVDFAAGAPPPSGTHVWVVLRPHARIGVFGDRSIVAPVEALGLPRMFWHPRLRLYDAGDGAGLHAALGILR